MGFRVLRYEERVKGLSMCYLEDMEKVGMRGASS